MKLWEKRNNDEWLNAAKGRAKRRLRKGKNKSGNHADASAYGNFVTVDAPEAIDMYKPARHKKTLSFINALEKSIRDAVADGDNAKCIHINFMKTKMITAAAGLLLLSKIECVLNNTLGEKPKFRVTRPKATRVKGVKDRVMVADSVLNRIGFYELLGYRHFNAREIANVKCWDVIKGIDVDSHAAGKMLQMVSKSIDSDDTGDTTRAIFRPLIEAMSNAVEHAYDQDLWKGKLPNGNRWWCFTATLMGKLTVLICDLGLGIPATLEKTQLPNVIAALKTRFGGIFSNDADYIKAAMDVKKTRTALGHRGKGATDLKSAIEKVENSSLCVFSNRGCYRYRNSIGSGDVFELNEDISMNDLSINGTIVEWTFPLHKGEINA